MISLFELAKLGQSIWLDYIRRGMIVSGEMQQLIDDGISGLTSNPAIFEQAIARSSDYDDALERLALSKLDTEAIYEALAIEDIQRTTDLLRPVYEHTGSDDGYASLEVSPLLAHDTGATIAAARRLFAAVNRPNVLIKVPATPAGIPAIETLIAEGININVTLMFSLDHYDTVAEAYIRGLEKLVADGDPGRVASVASFFLSRIDSLVDQRLEAMGTGKARSLQGKIAIASAKLAYQRFLQTFSGERWQRLAAKGARVQRVLWASTSTKNPGYPDTMYVDNVIGPQTINTAPPETIAAFRDHGTIARTIDKDVDTAREQLRQLSELGIDLDQATEQLQAEGVDKFAQPFNALLDTLNEKVSRLRRG